MNKISSGQLAVTFIITRMSAEMIIIPGDLIKYGADRFWSILFAKIIVLLLYLPAIFINIRFKGDNFFTASLRRSRIYGKILGFLFIVGLTSAILDTVLNIQMYVADTLLNRLLLLPGLLIIIGAAVYGAVKGISAVTRASIFAAGFYAVLLILVSVTMANRMETVYLYPSFIEDGSYFLRATVSEVACHSELLIFSVVCANIREKPNRTLYYLAVVFVLLEVTNLLYNLILGPYLDSVEYPMYLIASLSDIVVFQRLDGINAIVWLFSAIIKIALLLICAYQIYKDGARKPKKLLFISCYSLLIAALSFFVGTDRRIFDAFQNYMNSAVIVIAAGALIPLAALIGGKKRQTADSKQEGGK